jgi:hypothetical protein
VAVHESALTALKRKISVGSNGLITDIWDGRCRVIRSDFEVEEPESSLTSHFYGLLRRRVPTILYISRQIVVHRYWQL